MEIQQLFRNMRPIKVNVSQRMQAGQILRASIGKIFPQGQALSRIGNQQLIAQLETALAVGKSYYFQVMKQDGEVLHLRVLSESEGKPEENIKNLLKHFNLKETKRSLNFLRSLIDYEIPFQRQQLHQSIQLLDKVAHERDAEPIIKQMLLRKMPFTENVFYSLQRVNNEQLSSLLRDFNDTLLQPERSLPPSLIGVREQIQNEFQNVYQMLFQGKDDLSLLNRLQIHPEQFLFQRGVTNSIIPNNIVQYVNEQVIPLLENESILIQQAKQILQNLDHTFSTRNQSTQPTLVSTVIQSVHQNLLPLLSRNHQTTIASLLPLNTSEGIDLLSIRTFLTTLSDKHTYVKLNNFLQAFNANMPKQQFLYLAKQFMQQIGVTYEHDLVHNLDRMSDNTLKAQLIQLLASPDQVNQEQISKLLQFINGVQIQSVQETGHFLQANMIVLGEPFGFNKDIHINIESRKREDGKIDPKFCRILFYLDLASLQETVIDMNVQNEFVSITVFNEFPNRLREVAKPLENSLKEGLEAIQYKLSKVSYLPFKEQIQNKKDYSFENQSFEGIDYRI